MGLPRIFNIHEVMLLLLFGRLSIERANSDKMNADRIQYRRNKDQSCLMLSILLVRNCSQGTRKHLAYAGKIVNVSSWCVIFKLCANMLNSVSCESIAYSTVSPGIHCVVCNANVNRDPVRCNESMHMDLCVVLLLLLPLGCSAPLDWFNDTHPMDFPYCSEIWKTFYDLSCYPIEWVQGTLFWPTINVFQRLFNHLRRVSLFPLAIRHFSFGFFPRIYSCAYVSIQRDYSF